MTDDVVTAAEKAVVGASLISADAIRFAVEFCTPGDFRDVRLGKVWSLMVGMRSAGVKVDPITVDQRIREDGTIRGITGADLITLRQATPTAANIGYYARIVGEAATKRRLANAGLRMAQLGESDESLQTVMEVARGEWEKVRGEQAHHIVAKPLGQLLDGPDDYDWIIPHLLERQDRVIVTGGEGAGKSYFIQQIAIMAAAGLHPMTGQRVDPINVLVVDAENSDKQWRRRVRPLVRKAAQYGTANPAETMHIATVPRLNLTNERDLGSVHALLEEHQPDMLMIGPLYRLIPRAIQSDDDAAPLIAALDGLRAHGCALVMEAHAGHATKGVGGERDLRPRGSSALMGWPEFGFGLQLEDDNEGDLVTARLVRWRGDRDERAWPNRLMRGGTWPWSDFDPGTTQLMYEHKTRKKAA